MAGTEHFYRICGLSVSADLDLPGLIGLAASVSAPDVTIHSGSVPNVLDGATYTGPTWQIADKRFLLTIPDIARFLLSEGREIVYELEAGGDIADIPIFVLGTVFGILLHQRDQIVLHASAVRVNGKAVLFCGQSGAGKSTLAAALAQRGYPLMNDDVCAITIANGVPTVQSDGRQLKLWEQAIDRLALDELRGGRVRTRLEKFYVEPREVSSEPLPIGAVYALRETRPPNATGIERPNVVDGALLLRRNAYRPLIVRRLEQRANYFHAAAAMANSAGIYYLTRELSFAKMPDVVAMLEQHWDKSGLREKAA
jgi:hypothetical protein